MSREKTVREKIRALKTIFRFLLNIFVQVVLITLSFIIGAFLSFDRGASWKMPDYTKGIIITSILYSILSIIVSRLLFTQKALDTVAFFIFSPVTIYTIYILIMFIRTELWYM